LSLRLGDIGNIPRHGIKGNLVTVQPLYLPLCPTTVTNTKKEPYLVATSRGVQIISITNYRNRKSITRFEISDVLRVRV